MATLTRTHETIGSYRTVGDSIGRGRRGSRRHRGRARLAVRGADA